MASSQLPAIFQILLLAQLGQLGPERGLILHDPSDITRDRLLLSVSPNLNPAFSS
jgi:hypothetical protein